ncbi:MAG: zinc ribbon domain-containing protein [Anaerolineales bacterium]|nr:zinc ribbon domain-containing protein [Anaerolineales bacterium]
MARKESKGFVQLEWVCPNCDGRNPGPVKTCQNCGAPQPDNVQFHRAADEKIITDEKVVEVAKAGADIHCGFCGTRNPATASTCSQCGADLKEGKARAAGQVLQAAPAAPKVVTCTNCGAENPGSERMCAKCGSPLPRAATVQAQAAASSAQAAPVPVNVAKKKTNWLLFGGIGAFLLICCIAVVMIFALPSKTLTGTVGEVRWQTSVPVQELQEVNHTNESGDPPFDAKNVSCHDETEEICEEKTIDKGNGFAEVVQECHTESTKYCDYTVDEWTTIQTYTLEGNDLYPIYESPNVSSDQRVGSSSETLTVIFNTDHGQESYSTDSMTEFQQFEIGSVWTLKMNAIGGIVSIER